MPKLYRLLFKALLLIILVAGVVSNAAMLLRLGQPWGGFFAQWSQKNDAYLIVPGNHPSAPGLAPGDILPKDFIIEVTGVDLDSYNLPGAYRVLYDAGQRDVAYILSRAGHTLQAQGPLLLFRLEDFWDFRVSFVFTGFALWVLALIVFNASDAESNRAFAMFALAMSAQILPGTYEFDGSWEVLGRILTMVTMIAFLPLIGASLIHFSLTFPHSTPRVTRLARLAYLPAILVAMPYEYAIWNVKNSTPLLARIDRFGSTFGMAYAALGMGLLLVRFSLLAFRKGTAGRERRQSRLILLGFTLGALLPALPYGLYELCPGLRPRTSVLDYPSISFFLIVFIAYAILRYQLFRGRHNVLILLVMAALGALLAQLLVVGPGPYGYSVVFTLVFIVSFATSLFWQGNNRFNRLINRLLRRDVYQYAHLYHFIQATGQVSDLRQLTERVVKQLVRDFEAAYAALWLCQRGKPQHPGCVFVASEETAPTLTIQRVQEENCEVIAAWLDRVDGVSRIPDPYAKTAETERSLLPHAALIPLYDEAGQPKQRLGVILLGPRWTGDVYDKRDLELLTLIGQRAAASILIARQIIRLEDEPRRILAELERERDRIARELHDTVQQELGALPFKLDEIESSLSGHTQTLFEVCYESISRMSLDLQEIRHDLSPIELRRQDFQSALRQLVARTFAHTGIQARIAYDLQSQLNESQARALYRVCQQAFTNIVQHAHATQVKVDVVQQSADQLWIEIVDDGQGFEMPDIMTLQSRGHDGIAGMQSRVQALGGELKISSSPGKGTSVEITFPIG